MTPVSATAVRRRGLLFLAGGAAVLTAGLLWQGPALHAAEAAVPLPAPVQDAAPRAAPACRRRCSRAAASGACRVSSST